MNRETRMPAEYEPHEKTLMSWPVGENMCYPENYHEFSSELARAAVSISRFEPVAMLVNGNETDEAVLKLQGCAEIIEISHNDCWIRDNGPTVVLSGKNHRIGINWMFNAWGEKYPKYHLDNLAAPKILRHMSIAEMAVPLVMEGGSFHTDGEGTLLTTEECLLNKNRNPHISRKDIENTLKETLGIEKIIWFPKGLFGDETDGHIDNLACFASSGSILLQVCENPADPDYERSREHIRILKNETDAKGRRINIIPVPQPQVCLYRNRHLTLSYLNFYFVNNGIVFPVFNQATDLKALEIMSTVFPERDIITLDGLKLAKEGGNIHCLTQQIPRAT